MAYLGISVKDSAKFRLKRLLKIPRRDRDTDAEIDKILTTLEINIKKQYKERLRKAEEDAQKYYEIKKLLR